MLIIAVVVATRFAPKFVSKGDGSYGYSWSNQILVIALQKRKWPSRRVRRR